MSVVSLFRSRRAEPVPGRVVWNDFGVTISIDPDGTVSIDGAKKIKFAGEDIEFDAKRINMHASEEMQVNVNGDIFVGSSTHMIMQAPRIDTNPRILHTGYQLKTYLKKFIEEELVGKTVEEVKEANKKPCECVRCRNER